MSMKDEVKRCPICHSPLIIVFDFEHYPNRILKCVNWTSIDPHHYQVELGPPSNSQSYSIAEEQQD
jgi:hypothetical protein